MSNDSPKPENERSDAASVARKAEQELRDRLATPLIHILGCSERLLKDATAADNESWIVNLQQVQLAAQQMFLLVSPSSQPAPIRVSEVDTEFLTVQSEALRPRNEKGSLLIVDDSEANRDLLALLLEQQGYSVAVAETGEQGLWMIQSKKFDLMLLDLVLPGIDGYEVLKCMKADVELRHIPVVMLSGADQQDKVIRCIEIGAEDFLAKPFNPVLLRARIDASLEKKRFRDHEQAYVAQLQVEQQKSETLLLNTLPKVIADRLRKGESPIVDAFPSVTVLFADLAGFTGLSTNLSPVELVQFLNEIFSEFDRLVDFYDLEKIKTIGDAYMVVGGLPLPRDDHAEAIASIAIDMQSVIAVFNAKHGANLKIRIGINTGPVIAGIIGKKKFIYDLWGDTVNTASRMESHGHPGHIQITETTYLLIQDKFIFAKRGSVRVKGKGEMTTYLVMAKKPA